MIIDGDDNEWLLLMVTMIDNFYVSYQWWMVMYGNNNG